jgi:hypothetical protein
MVSNLKINAQNLINGFDKKDNKRKTNRDQILQVYITDTFEQKRKK